MQQLQDQLTNPQHCYIKLSTGKLVSHQESHDDGKTFLRGDPIRFTKLAATRLIKDNIWLGNGAMLVPIS